jgi:hypothetical protein
MCIVAKYRLHKFIRGKSRLCKRILWLADNLILESWAKKFNNGTGKIRRAYIEQGQHENIVSRTRRIIKETMEQKNRPCFLIQEIMFRTVGCKHDKPSYHGLQINKKRQAHTTCTVGGGDARKESWQEQKSLPQTSVNTLVQTPNNLWTLTNLF